MNLQTFNASSQSSIRDVHGVTHSCQLPPTSRKVITLVFAGMLLQSVWFWAWQQKRFPAAIMHFAIMNICTRKNQRQWDSVLVYDDVPFGAQLPSISRVLPGFFPLSQVPRPCGCPESAIAMLSLSDRHTRAGSAPTFFRTLLQRPSAGSTGVSCSQRNTPWEASSTDSQSAERRRLHSRSFAHLQPVFRQVPFFSLVWECIPLLLPRTHHGCLSTRGDEAAVVGSPSFAQQFPSHEEDCSRQSPKGLDTWFRDAL